MSVSDEELIRRQRESQRGFYRSLAGASAGAEVVDFAGAQATVVPARKWFSIFNSVLYRDVADLEHAYDRVKRAYADAGVKAWTVWVPPGDTAAAELLERRGHKLDSDPMLFAAPIEAIDLEPRTGLELDPEPSWGTVARVNDRAHGILEPWSMAAVFEGIDDDAAHIYAARRDGEAVSALLARHLEGDCYFWLVATVPEAQGRGIAAELMRTALRDARVAGCTTTTLESTKVAEGLYAGLGYRALGRYQMWELREQ